jgi:hypothetical protein
MGCVSGTFRNIPPKLRVCDHEQAEDAMSRKQKVAAVEAYLDSFVTKNVSQVPFAEDGRVLRRNAVTPFSVNWSIVGSSNRPNSERAVAIFPDGA